MSLIEQYIGIEEASKLIHMPVSTIREKVNQGILPAYKPGKALLFLPSELRQFVTRFKVER